MLYLPCRTHGLLVSCCFLGHLDPSHHPTWEKITLNSLCGAFILKTNLHFAFTVVVHDKTHNTTFGQLVFLFAVQLCINTGCFWYIFNTSHLKSHTSFVTSGDVLKSDASIQMFIYMRDTRGGTHGHKACRGGAETKEEGRDDEEAQSKSALIDRFVVSVGNMFEISLHNWRTHHLQTSAYRAFWIIQ